MLITDAFPNATFDNVNSKVVIPIADLGLTAAQADAATGDVRLLVANFLRRVATAYNATNPQPSAITIAVGNPTPSGVVNQFNQSITATFPRVFDEADISPIAAG